MKARNLIAVYQSNPSHTKWIFEGQARLVKRGSEKETLPFIMLCDEEKTQVAGPFESWVVQFRDVHGSKNRGGQWIYEDETYTRWVRAQDLPTRLF